MLNLIESEVDLCAGHDPKSRLLHAAKVVVAVSRDVVGLDIELVVALCPS